MTREQEMAVPEAGLNGAVSQFKSRRIKYLVVAATQSSLCTARCQALVQMAMPDQLGWRAERAEVVDGQAEGGSGAFRGSPLRPRSHHPVRALVSSIQAQSARSGGDDGRAWPVDGAYDHYALGAALRTGVRETLATICPGGRPVLAGRRDLRQDPGRVVLPVSCR